MGQSRHIKLDFKPLKRIKFHRTYRSFNIQHIAWSRLDVWRGQKSWIRHGKRLDPKANHFRLATERGELLRGAGLLVLPFIIFILAYWFPCFRKWKLRRFATVKWWITGVATRTSCYLDELPLARVATRMNCYLDELLLGRVAARTSFRSDDLPLGRVATWTSCCSDEFPLARVATRTSCYLDELPLARVATRMRLLQVAPKWYTKVKISRWVDESVWPARFKYGCLTDTTSRLGVGIRFHFIGRGWMKLT